MNRPMSGVAVQIRSLVRNDLEEVVSIDALHTGMAKPEYWKEKLGGFLAAGKGRVGLAAEERENSNSDVRLAGYLFGETRAFEFGSMKCGWIFAVGVRPEASRSGVATLLLEVACNKFRAAGIPTIRTMVRGNNVPVLSFFRSRGFVGGPFVQLERTFEGDS